MKHHPLKNVISCTAIFFSILYILGTATPAAQAQANVKGQWTTMSTLMPINPIHTALLYNGKILVVAGSGNCPPSQSGCPTGPPYGPSNGSGALLFDPTNGNITQFTVSWDMFCNAMVMLPDGRVFINGGSIQYDPFLGITKSSIFDPANNTFTDVQNMAHGRWYPTTTNLGDGRVMTFSGQNEVNAGTNNAVEIYTAGTGWSTQYIANWTPPLYPRMHLLPNGKVFYSGSGPTSKLFDPSSQTWTTMDTTVFGADRLYGTSVLFPLTPGNSYRPKVIIMGGGNPSTATTETIDLGASSPTWQSGPNMSQPRIEMSAVMLPNGKILAIGGSLNDEITSSASLNADMYDTGANTFSSAGANAYARLYHSVALLLPDATVWFAGGNPTRGSYEQHMEIYKPPYLFNSSGGAATRPTISSAPPAISWNGSFSISTPDAANISSVVLIRPGSPTHAFDMEQRLVGLSFTAGSGTLTVTGPPNGNVAPPGYYMIFLVNSSGVPSVAKFTKLSSTGGNPAPTVSSISPTSGTTAGGTSVTITGTGFLSGAQVTLGGAAATSETVVNTTTITAVTPAHAAGAISVVVTNTDTQTGTLTNGYTYTASNPAPTVSSISPTSGTTAGGTSVTITGTGFLSGAQVTLGGTAATSETVVNSTTITAVTPAHAAGAVSVVVTNSDSQSGTLTNGYTYTTSGGGGGTIAFVQVNAATPQVNSSSVPVAYPLAQTAGNMNVVAVGWNDTTSTVTGISDSRGNSYTLAIGPTTGAGLRQSIYYAKNIAAGSNTVTVTFSQAAVYVDVRVLEYSGLDTVSPLDKTAGAAGNGTLASSGAATTTAASELIFGAGMTTSHFNSAGTGFISRIITNPDADIAEDQTVSSIGSYNATAPTTTSNWVMQMATFKASGQGSGNPAPTVTTIAPTSGPTTGGTAITITGTGFLAGATVSLGGTAATGVTVVNSTSITATSPAHAAGAVNVVVTNSDAQTDTLTNGYTYTASNPAPTVSSISPTSGTTAGGTSVTITGTGFLSGAQVTLGGAAATSETVVNSTTITAVTPAHAAGAVSVVVTNTDNQTDTLANGYTYTASNPAPTVSSISPTSGTTAGGTSVTITGTGFLSGAQVTLGGAAATSETVVNSTTITAVTAAHAAGAVSVVVTNTDNQTGTLTNGYTYTTSGGGGTIAFVQVNAATPQVNSSSVSVAYPLAQTLGNLNIVAVGWNDTASTVTSVSDSRGNVYTLAIGPTSGTGLRQSIYYAKNIAAGSNTVTVTFSQAAVYVDIRVLEYSGLDTTNPLDVTAGAAGTGTSASSGSATTTTAKELIFGAGMTTTHFNGPGTGFVSRIITNPDADIAEDQQVTSTGTYSATAPTTSSNWVMQMATFRVAQ